jgi:putative addiction module component (TIGR02574 family)
MQLTHDEITRLSPDERLALIAQLWDSLDDDQVQLTTAQQAELERRFTTLDQDRSQTVTWETLKAELAQRVAPSVAGSLYRSCLRGTY